jgi:hypothetical protein
VTRRDLAGLGLGLGAAAAVWMLLGPIAQDPAYHAFADRRVVFGVPYFWNVVSNTPFLLVGALGLGVLARGVPFAAVFRDSGERRPFGVFFAGVLLTGIGYYHRVPTNGTLVWDRLPMTVAFMGLLAAAIGERVDRRLGSRLLGPLVGLGVVSVLYWDWTERGGSGDLRLYALVQFGPLVALPALFRRYSPRYTRGTDWLVALAWYGAALALDRLDRAVFALGEVVSGHTLKHLAAALSAYWLLRMLRLRKPVDPGSTCQRRMRVPSGS